MPSCEKAESRVRIFLISWKLDLSFKYGLTRVVLDTNWCAVTTENRKREPVYSIVVCSQLPALIFIMGAKIIPQRETYHILLSPGTFRYYTGVIPMSSSGAMEDMSEVL